MVPPPPPPPPPPNHTHTPPPSRYVPPGFRMCGKYFCVITKQLVWRMVFCECSGERRVVCMNNWNDYHCFRLRSTAFPPPPPHLPPPPPPVFSFFFFFSPFFFAFTPHPPLHFCISELKMSRVVQIQCKASRPYLQTQNVLTYLLQV